MPEGKVYWSKADQAFYQEGVEGQIPLVEAKRFLTYNEAADRYIDQKKQFVPNSAFEPSPTTEHNFISHDKDGNAFVSTTWSGQTISRDAALTYDVGTNQEIVITCVIRMPDGSLETVRISTGLGKGYDPDYHDGLLNRRIQAALINKTSKEVGYLADIESMKIRTFYEVLTISKP